MHPRACVQFHGRPSFEGGDRRHAYTHSPRDFLGIQPIRIESKRFAFLVRQFALPGILLILYVVAGILQIHEPYCFAIGRLRRFGSPPAFDSITCFDRHSIRLALRRIANGVPEIRYIRFRDQRLHAAEGRRLPEARYGVGGDAHDADL